MTQDAPRNGCQPLSNGARGSDRRVCSQLKPPPYQTITGVVLKDRRSYLDRRASWIRSYVIEGGNGDPA